jgi:hypothetical protein
VEKMAEQKDKAKLFSEQDFDELSKRNMNGRQVRDTFFSPGLE